MRGPSEQPHLADDPKPLQRWKCPNLKSTSLSPNFLFGAVRDLRTSCLDGQGEHTGSAPSWKCLSAVTIAASRLGPHRGWSICLLPPALFQATLLGHHQSTLVASQLIAASMHFLHPSHHFYTFYKPHLSCGRQQFISFQALPTLRWVRGAKDNLGHLSAADLNSS